jgi:hypothetical protein
LSLREEHIIVFTIVSSTSSLEGPRWDGRTDEKTIREREREAGPSANLYIYIWISRNTHSSPGILLLSFSVLKYIYRMAKNVKRE